MGGEWVRRAVALAVMLGGLFSDGPVIRCRSVTLAVLFGVVDVAFRVAGDRLNLGGVEPARLPQARRFDAGRNMWKRGSLSPSY
jgi:hypothetical protein